MTASASGLNRSAALASTTTALFLAALKGWATWRTGSTAMLGSLADTALDLVASLVTLTGVWIASRPADEQHRFGHGKAEALAAFLQVILIALSAAGIMLRATVRLIEGGRVAAAGEAAGRTTPVVFSAAQTIICGRTDAEVRRRAEAAKVDVDDVRGRGLYGTPAEIVDRLGEFARAGAQRVHLQFLDLDDLDHLDLGAAEVAAKLR